jgi:hypothetical protein
MPKQAKRIQAWTGDRTVSHPVADAVKMVKANATAKFDETVEIAINLGVDPRHADQQVRGVVNLPSGTGRDVRVAVSGEAITRSKSINPPWIRSARSSAPTTSAPPAAPMPKPPPRPALKWSALKTSPSVSRAGLWTSTA